MEIIKATGVLKTPDQKVTKSIGALLICVTKEMADLSAETITVWIERVNRGNVYLATSVKLQDFIALTAFGADSIQSNATYKTIALCELCPDGKALHLNEGESLQFKLDSLTSAQKYDVYGIEEPETTFDFYKFDRKTVASEDTQRRLTVEGNELVVFNVENVSDIVVGFGNGKAIKYSPFELQTVTRDVDPVFALTPNGVVQGIEGKILMPVYGIEYIEFEKASGNLITMTSRSDFNLLEVE